MEIIYNKLLDGVSEQAREDSLVDGWKNTGISSWRR